MLKTCSCSKNISSINFLFLTVFILFPSFKIFVHFVLELVPQFFCSCFYLFFIFCDVLFCPLMNSDLFLFCFKRFVPLVAKKSSIIFCSWLFSFLFHVVFLCSLVHSDMVLCSGRFVPLVLEISSIIFLFLLLFVLCYVFVFPSVL
jgi:hypothetical protein